MKLRRASGAAAHALATALAALACAACDSSEGTVDGGVGSDDAAVVVEDAGVRARCPAHQNPACDDSTDCSSDTAAEINCGGCTPYNQASLCVAAQCVQKTPLGPGDPYNLKLPVSTALAAQVKSFAGFVVANETAGGLTIECEDVYAGRVDLSDGCYNVLDSRGSPAIGRVGDIYTLTFTRFASEQKVLFVVYGFSEMQARGNRVGVSCAEADIGTPGMGLQNVSGDMMRPI